ncbi:MAG: hypothetical protein ABFC63_02135 [Thermoguttaceae bacterium]
MPRPLIKWVMVALVLLASSGLIVVGWAVFDGTRTSLEAERTNQAYLLVLDLVAAHVARNGEWPKGWEDLQSTSPKRIGGTWRWPEDATQVQMRVFVDFAIRCEDVGQMTPDSFCAVTQTNPNYGPEKDAVKRLLKECQKCAGSKVK